MLRKWKKSFGRQILHRRMWAIIPLKEVDDEDIDSDYDNDDNDSEIEE